jgi:hypothetical protein
MSHGDALAVLRQALEDRGSQVRGTAARCPAHDDRQASLSIGQGNSGAVLKCQAGCETDAVLEALGMSAADLFDEPRGHGSGGGFEVVATYTYTDEHGVELFRAERRMPKGFRQYHVVNGQKVWSLQGVRRVLYRLPQVIEAVAAGQLVYVAEGEKDVHAIEAAGAVATCNPMGAGKWQPEYGDFLKGADVIVIADNDQRGREHAAAVADDLSGKAKSVRVVQPAVDREHADASDHLAAGHALTELVPAGPLSRLDELRAALLTSAALDRLPIPEPLIDGLLYRDSLAWLHGKPGDGKSLVSLDWACCIDAGRDWMGRKVRRGPVLYVIAEGATGLRPRVRAWEDRAGRRTGVIFLPVAVQMLAPGDPQAVATIAADLGCVLVVLDTQARVTVGADENSAVEMGRVVDAAEMIRTRSRACVQFVHHESRGSEHMRGSTALEGAATSVLRVVKDGSRIELTNPKQKDAAEADPITVWVSPRLQSVVITGQAEGPMLDLRADSETKILKALLDLFGTTGASATLLRETTNLTRSTFFWALNRLVKDGLITNIGTSKKTQYMITQAQLPIEVQEVQQGPSPTGPMSNDASIRGVIGPAASDELADDDRPMW